jgi:hypothetical protein
VSFYLAAAVGASATHHDLVSDDRVAAPLLDRLERTLEPPVGEGLHLAAGVADEMVVMVMPDRLVPSDPSPTSTRCTSACSASASSMR